MKHRWKVTTEKFLFLSYDQYNDYVAAAFSANYRSLKRPHNAMKILILQDEAIHFHSIHSDPYFGDILDEKRSLIANNWCKIDSSLKRIVYILCFIQNRKYCLLK